MNRNFTIIFHSLCLSISIFLQACSPEPNNNSTTATRSSTERSMPNPSDDPGSPSAAGQSGVRGESMTFQQPPITDPDEILNATNAVALTSRTAQLSRLQVLQLLEWPFVLVGADTNRALLVQLKERNEKIIPGAYIDVSGTIFPSGSDPGQWNVDDNTRELIRRHAVIINARQVNIVQ